MYVILQFKTTKQKRKEFIKRKTGRIKLIWGLCGRVLFIPLFYKSTALLLEFVLCSNGVHSIIGDN